MCFVKNDSVQHIDLYSIRQSIAGLFLFSIVDSVPLPRQDEEPGFKSLSKVVELMIRLAVSVIIVKIFYKILIFDLNSTESASQKKNYERVRNEIRTLKRGQFVSSKDPIWTSLT